MIRSLLDLVFGPTAARPGEDADELGLRMFAAWCNVSPRRAATKQAWAGRHARGTREAWARVEKAARDYLRDQGGDDDGAR